MAKSNYALTENRTAIATGHGVFRFHYGPLGDGLWRVVCETTGMSTVCTCPCACRVWGAERAEWLALYRRLCPVPLLTAGPATASEQAVLVELAA